MVASESSRRNGSLDLARWIGAIGIVWFHESLPLGWIGYAALPFFVILVMYLGADKSLKSRAERLMVPWLVWSVVYGFLKVLDAWHANVPLSAEFRPWMFLTGPGLHLWFLPFCMMFLILFRRLRNPALAIVAPVLSLLALWLGNIVSLPIPFAQWIFVLPAALLGLQMNQSAQPLRIATGYLVGCLACWGLLGWDYQTPQLAVAILMLIVALAFPMRASRLTSALAATSMAIYLLHPMVGALGLRLGFHKWDLLLWTLVVLHMSVFLLWKFVPPNRLRNII